VVQHASTPTKWIVVKTFEGGEDEYETAVSAAEITRLGGTGLPCVRVADIYGHTSPETCPEPAPLLFRLTVFETFHESGTVFETFVAGGYGPAFVPGCLSNPGDCYIAIYRPKGTPAGSIEIAIVGPDKNLANGMVFASDAPVADPGVLYPNLAEIAGNTAIGSYHVSTTQRHEANFTMTGTDIGGFLAIVAEATAADPGATLVDGVLLDRVDIRIAGMLVE
jgi:hypothetical protein